MEVSAIGAASIQMHMGETMQAVSIAMLRKVMQSQQGEAAALLEQLEAAAPQLPERLLDIHV